MANTTRKIVEAPEWAHYIEAVFRPADEFDKRCESIDVEVADLPDAPDLDGKVVLGWRRPGNDDSSGYYRIVKGGFDVWFRYENAARWDDDVTLICGPIPDPPPPTRTREQLLEDLYSAEVRKHRKVEGSVEWLDARADIAKILDELDAAEKGGEG